MNKKLFETGIVISLLLIGFTIMTHQCNHDQLEAQYKKKFDNLSLRLGIVYGKASRCNEGRASCQSK